MNESELVANAWKAWPHTYAQYHTRDLPPDQRWVAHPHLRLVSLTITEMLDNGGGVLLVSMPPRHGKSELISRWTPEWFLNLYPRRRVIELSYSAELAEDWSGRVRDGLGMHGGKIKDDKSSKAWWGVAAGGSMTAAGIGGSITGKGGDVIIIDDAIKNAEEAASETIRAKQKKSFNMDILTRRQPGCLIIVLMTRWHADDLYAHVKASVPGYREIVLPALCEEEGDPLGRKIGEPLCPAMIPLSMLEEFRIVLTTHEWNALFQQRPTSAEGAEIKRHWWRWYDELPIPRESMDFVAASWDCAFRDTDGSDYVVGQVWGVYGADRYLLDQVRERMDFTSTVHAVQALNERWRPNVTLIEAKANGDAVINVLTKHVSGVVPVMPIGGKESRARAAAPQIMAGNVYIPRTRWAEELVEEASAFPLGKHDDMVDACSQALNWLLHWQTVHLSHLKPGDNRFVPTHVLDLQRRTSVGFGLVPPGLRKRT